MLVVLFSCFQKVNHSYFFDCNFSVDTMIDAMKKVIEGGITNDATITSNQCQNCVSRVDIFLLKDKSGRKRLTNMSVTI